MTTRRPLPALGLLLLAPLVAEFLLGDLPVSDLAALVGLVPLYGCGALLIREVARRTGRGWPAIITLALAYGVLEEGFLTQTLFDPHWPDPGHGPHPLDFGYVSWLGMGPPWTLFVLCLHTVWSISVPILLTEAVAGPPRDRPWLGSRWLAVVALVFVASAVGTGIGTAGRQHFLAVPGQFAGAGVAVALLVALALRRPVGSARPTGRPAPRPWLAGLVALLAGSLFMLVNAVSPAQWGNFLAAAVALPAWLAVLGYVVLFVGTGLLIRAWSRRPGWGGRHLLAVGAGALLVYAWHAFTWPPFRPAGPAVVLAGHLVFGAGAITLLAIAASRVTGRGGLVDSGYGSGHGQRERREEGE